jgi:hypothetical protein
MKKRGYSHRGGYVGLLALLITFTIIVFLYFSILSPKEGGQEGAGAVSEQLEGINQAKRAKEALEAASRFYR